MVEEGTGKQYKLELSKPGESVKLRLVVIGKRVRLNGTHRRRDRVVRMGATGKLRSSLRVALSSL